jgi:hypothetical protein
MDALHVAGIHGIFFVFLYLLSTRYERRRATSENILEKYISAFLIGFFISIFTGVRIGFYLCALRGYTRQCPF